MPFPSSLFAFPLPSLQQCYVVAVWVLASCSTLLIISDWGCKKGPYSTC